MMFTQGGAIGKGPDSFRSRFELGWCFRGAENSPARKFYSPQVGVFHVSSPLCSSLNPLAMQRFTEYFGVGSALAPVASYVESEMHGDTNFQFQAVQGAYP